jgi:hypothetical protein
MQKSAILVMLLSSLLGLFSCTYWEHVVHSEASNSFSQVFEGFVYVGVDVERESHYSCGIEMPRKIAVDHDYVFHHASPFNEAEFARTVLPERLKKLGFSVTKAVDAGQGFVSIGEIDMWSVNFARGSCSGIIGNSTCFDFKKRRLFRISNRQPSDYILVLHGNCEQ